MFQAATMETVLYLLDDVDLPSSPAKKTSRELSGLVLETLNRNIRRTILKIMCYILGTLRNLKKVEQALEVLNKIICDDS